MTSFSLVILVLGLLMGMGSAQDFDYCAKSRKHTMCVYKDESLGKACGKDAAPLTMTDQERNNIVKKHNELRSKVALGNETRGKDGPQPAAANMMELVRDNELEEIAKRWALQCIRSHDSQEGSSKFYSYGQNSGYSDGTQTWASQIEGWYNEVDRMTSSARKSYKSPKRREDKFGHFTYIIWAETTNVGCAGIQINKPDGVTTHMFCNYGPAGNQGLKPVYIERVDGAGAQCPGGSVANSETGLCVLQPKSEK